MPLSYSAFVPHSPLLIPTIGKENRKILQKTLESYHTITQQLKDKHIETVILVSPHFKANPDKTIINSGKDFNIKFHEFGDLASKMNIKGDTILAHYLKEELKSEVDIDLTTKEELDHGSAIPLFLLNQDNNLKTVVLSPQENNLTNNYHTGHKLQEIISNQNKNIAIIASGDLSHCLTKSSPGGFSPKGKKFDNRVMEIISSQSPENIINLDKNLIRKAGECGLNSVSFLLGALSNTNFKTKKLAYQNDFGIGYLTSEFICDY